MTKARIVKAIEKNDILSQEWVGAPQQVTATDTTSEIIPAQNGDRLIFLTNVEKVNLVYLAVSFPAEFEKGMGVELNSPRVIPLAGGLALSAITGPSKTAKIAWQAFGEAP